MALGQSENKNKLEARKDELTKGNWIKTESKRKYLIERKEMKNVWMHKLLTDKLRGQTKGRRQNRRIKIN